VEMTSKFSNKYMHKNHQK